MISTLSLLLFSLQTAQPSVLPKSPASTNLVTVEAPDVRFGQALQRAKNQLDYPLPGCNFRPDCDDVAIISLAKTAIGAFGLARYDLKSSMHYAPLWLVALHNYWLATDDDELLQELEVHFFDAFTNAAADSIRDAGLWLAMLDAVLGIAGGVSDVEMRNAASAQYTSAEQRLAKQPSLFGLAWGLYEPAHAVRLLGEMMPTVQAMWPIGSGLVSLAHYEYHRDSTAFALLSRITRMDSVSAPMLVLPLVRGLIGWETDAPNRAAALEPHLPAQWNWLRIYNLPLANDQFEVALRRDGTSYMIAIERERPGRPISLRISPSLPAGARVRNVMVNENDVPVHVETHDGDVHVVIELTFHREAQVEIDYELTRRKRASAR